MVIIKKKLCGSTLIETLDAMTLLVTAFTLSFLVITSIKRSYNNTLLVYAYMEAESLIQQSDSLNIGKQEIIQPPFTMSLCKEQYDSIPFLFITRITVISQDSIKLFEISSIRKENNYTKKLSE